MCTWRTLYNAKAHDHAIVKVLNEIHPKVVLLANESHCCVVTCLQGACSVCSYDRNLHPMLFHYYPTHVGPNSSQHVITNQGLRDFEVS